jgi:hypothetical protein
MKIVRITHLNKECVRGYISKIAGFSGKSYNEQKEILDYQAFEWSDYWSNAMRPFGYEFMEVISNVEPMQRAWARENGLLKPDSMNLEEIAFTQTKKFAPEIVWYEDSSEELLKRIRSEIPSIRLVLGWTGSAIPRTRIWAQIDLVLSCAQESVNTLKSIGCRAEQLHHGFDPRVIGRLKPGPKTIDFSFIGQLLRSDQFHLYRDQLLEKIASELDISIFSPSANYGWMETGKANLMGRCYDVFNTLKSLGFPETTLENLPVIGRAIQWKYRPVSPVNPKLKPFLFPPVYGLEMFQVLKNSKITLNIHADSSPEFASNMRLFETTGVGTCLVTDWKRNIHQLFEPDKEVVVYKSTDECVEKMKWLLDHDKEREEIGSAGQKRTLESHTYPRRAEQLDSIITRQLKK